ncbi:MAG: hypothetical protein OEZ13_00315 [Spirochaetia bacterium]|nr:hypothetical protein [Spirochaetia bacterium]
MRRKSVNTIFNYLAFLFILIIVNCSSVKTIGLKYEITLPYRYYKVISNPKLSNKITPAAAPWEEENDQKHIEETRLFLFCEDNALETSYDYLFNGKYKEVIALLESKIEFIKDNEIRAKYLNNAAIAYFFNKEEDKARNYFNQAGIYSDSKYILHNFRIFNNTLSTRFEIIKYGDN